MTPLRNGRYLYLCPPFVNQGFFLTWWFLKYCISLLSVGYSSLLLSLSHRVVSLNYNITLSLISLSPDCILLVATVSLKFTTPAPVSNGFMSLCPASFSESSLSTQSLISPSTESSAVLAVPDVISVRVVSLSIDFISLNWSRISQVSWNLQHKKKKFFHFFPFKIIKEGYLEPKVMTKIAAHIHQGRRKLASAFNI